MAVPALVIVPTSPDGTKVMTIGLSGAPSVPAAAVGMPSNLLQTGGIAVGAGAAAVGAAAAAVGAPGTGVLTPATAMVGLAGTLAVGAVQADNTIAKSDNNDITRYSERLLNIFHHSPC